MKIQIYRHNLESASGKGFRMSSGLEKERKAWSSRRVHTGRWISKRTVMLQGILQWHCAASTLDKCRNLPLESCLWLSRGQSERFFALYCEHWHRIWRLVYSSRQWLQAAQSAMIMRNAQTWCVRFTTAKQHNDAVVDSVIISTTRPLLKLAQTTMRERFAPSECGVVAEHRTRDLVLSKTIHFVPHHGWRGRFLRASTWRRACESARWVVRVATSFPVSTGIAILFLFVCSFIIWCVDVGTFHWRRLRLFIWKYIQRNHRNNKERSHWNTLKHSFIYLFSCYRFNPLTGTYLRYFLSFLHYWRITSHEHISNE